METTILQPPPLGQMLPLEFVFASKTNPRKRFNETDLNELAESIKAHGVNLLITTFTIMAVIR